MQYLSVCPSKQTILKKKSSNSSLSHKKSPSQKRFFSRRESVVSGSSMQILQIQAEEENPSSKLIVASRKNDKSTNSMVRPSLSTRNSSNQQNQHLPMIENQAVKEMVGSSNHPQKETLQNNRISVVPLISKYGSSGDSKNQLPTIKRSYLTKRSTFASSLKLFKYSPITLEQALIKDIIRNDSCAYEAAEFSDSDSSPATGMSKASTFQNFSAGAFSSQQNGTNKDFLQGHDIQPYYRARMIDWMVQVFRVMKISSPQTFFLAVSIMDRYFQVKQHLNQKVHKESLHLLGISSIFLSSKFEDVIPIHMRQVLNDVAHGKFSQSDILEMERQVLITLEFKIQSQTIYEEASIIFKQCEYNYKTKKIEKKDITRITEYIQFISNIVINSMEFMLYPMEDLSIAIVNVAMKFLKKRYQAKLQKKKLLSPNMKFHTDQLYQNFSKLLGLIKHFKVQYLDPHINLNQSKNLSKKIIMEYLNFEEVYPGLKNLEKNYPLNFSEESRNLFRQKIVI